MSSISEDFEKLYKSPYDLIEGILASNDVKSIIYNTEYYKIIFIDGSILYLKDTCYTKELIGKLLEK